MHSRSSQGSNFYRSVMFFDKNLPIRANDDYSAMFFSLLPADSTRQEKNAGPLDVRLHGMRPLL